MHFCLLGAEESLLAITGSDRGTFANAGRTAAGPAAGGARLRAGRRIIDQGLHEFIDHFQTKLNLVGEGISETFFAPRPVGSPAMMMQRQYQ